MITFREYIELINEDLSRKDLYKHFDKIEYSDYNKLVDLDPTSTKNNVGKYSNWILNLYRNKKLKVSDTKVTALLTNFNKSSNTLVRTKINKYNNVLELEKALQGIDDKEIKSDYLDKGSKVIYNDDTWVVEIPQSYEQSCRAYGRKTKWCTASKDYTNSYYNHYKSTGELYVLRKLHNSLPEAQFHIKNDEEGEEVQDIKNDPYDYDTLFEKYPKLYKFFKKLAPSIFDLVNTIKFAGRKIKFAIVNNIRVFKNVDISDAGLKTLPDLGKL